MTSWELGLRHRVVRVVIASGLLATTAVIPGVAEARTSSPTTASDAAHPAHPAHPAHEFGVGRREVTLVDSTRPTPADPNRGWPEKPDRTIPTIILYPTDGDPAAPAELDAPATEGKFPLVVFSHGFTASGGIYAPGLEPLVRRGYIVALPTFPLSSGPQGYFLDFVNQPGDVSFVIDEMFRLTQETDSWLSGRVNKRRVAAAGHSLGAVTTLGVTYNSCCLDPRIKAAIPLSGGPLDFPGGEYQWPGIPLLLIHGVQDRVAPVWASDLVFDAATGKTFYLRLSEADHVSLLLGEDGALTAQAIGTFLDGKLKGRWRPLQRFGQVAADSGRGEWRTKLV